MTQGNLDLIPNPFADVDASVCLLVQARISPKVFNYFFRRIFVGERGPRNNMIALFFDAFYKECLASGIDPKAWDEDDAAKVAEILKRINFKPDPKKPKVKHE